MPRPSGRHGRRACRAAALVVWATAAMVAMGCLPRLRRSPPVDVVYVYTCPGDYRFGVREFGDVATVRLPMRDIALPRVRTASGSRYAAEGTEFWNRGQMATLTIGSERHTECVGQVAATAWDEARMIGVDYRAIGYEPVWTLEIDTGKAMRFILEGGGPVYMPVPNSTGDAKRMVYRAVTGAQELEVIIEEKQCRDPARAEPFPHTVTVTFNGIPYQGCGTSVAGV